MENTIWGLIVLICGIFIASYGSVLFRFALAFMGFALGFSLVMWLGGGLDSGIRIVAGLVLGGILAAVFYFLVKFTLHIAGGIVGLVLMLGLLGLFKLSGLDLGFLNWVLVLAAAGVGAFFGNRLGDLVIILAASLGAAYLVVLGLGALYQVGVNVEQPLALLGTSFPLVMFLTVFAISFLGQYQTQSLRRRFLR